MERNDKMVQNQDSDFRKLQTFCYGMVLTIVFGTLALRRDAILTEFALPQSTSALPLFICRIVLFLITLFYVVQWFAATAHELSLWVRWLDFVFMRGETYIATFGLAVALGMLLVFVPYIALFSAYFSAFLLLHYWWQWLCNEYFVRASARRSIRESKDTALPALRHYWLDRPLLGRIVTMLFFSMIAFSIALTGTVTEGDASNTLKLSAYLVMILTIGGSEVIILYWRRARDRAIEEAAMELELGPTRERSRLRGPWSK